MAPGRDDEDAASPLNGAYAANHEIVFSDQDVAYLRDKADYIRLVARSAATPGTLDAPGITTLLERLAREFEERAFEIERDLKARRSREG